MFPAVHVISTNWKLQNDIQTTEHMQTCTLFSDSKTPIHAQKTRQEDNWEYQSWQLDSCKTLISLFNLMSLGNLWQKNKMFPFLTFNMLRTPIFPLSDFILSQMPPPPTGQLWHAITFQKCVSTVLCYLKLCKVENFTKMLILFKFQTTTGISVSLSVHQSQPWIIVIY